jgi:hypothetical protein
MEVTKEMSLKSPSQNNEKQVLKWTPILSKASIQMELPLICGHRAEIYQNYLYIIEGFDGDYTPACLCFALGKKVQFFGTNSKNYIKFKLMPRCRALFTIYNSVEIKLKKK